MNNKKIIFILTAILTIFNVNFIYAQAVENEEKVMVEIKAVDTITDEVIALDNEVIEFHYNENDENSTDRFFVGGVISIRLNHDQSPSLTLTALNTSNGNVDASASTMLCLYNSSNQLIYKRSHHFNPLIANIPQSNEVYSVDWSRATLSETVMSANGSSITDNKVYKYDRY